MSNKLVGKTILSEVFAKGFSGIINFYSNANVIEM